MGRKPIGKAPLTNAERQAKHRAKINAELSGLRGGKDKRTPEGIARARFLEYVDNRLAGEWDTSAWEFWTWLLGQAKKHPTDTSGLATVEFQKDSAVAKAQKRG